MKVVVLGSDLRMQTIYHHFCHKTDAFLLDCTSDLSKLHDFDVLILPIRAVDEVGNLQCGDHVIKTDELFWNKAKKAIIFAGSRDMFLSQFDNVIYYMEAEEVKKQNAYLTAEGMLYYMIDQTSRSIFSLHVDIIGKGLCGGVFGNLLEQIGISVRYVRRDATKENEIGIEEWKMQHAGDVVVITAPVPIIDDDWLRKQTHDPVLIDIVSHSVLNESLAQQLGYPYIKALGIPAIFAYNSAGTILFEWIWGKLHER